MHGKAHIVGGGIAGMAVAACLADRGWKVVVHERASELREVGAGIYLKENSVRVLDSLGCIESLVKRGSRLKRSEIRDGAGRILLSRDISSERVYTVLREELHRWLADAASRRGVQFELGVAIHHVSPDGVLVTETGNRYRADLVVGADGLGSVVRKQAGLEVSAGSLPNGSTRILVPRSNGDPAEGSIEYWRGHKRVMVVPVGRNITYFCASSREDDTRGVRLPFDADYWTACFPELADLFSRVTPDLGVHHAHGLVRVSGWYRGRLAIVGDSVHGQPPNLGQGAGMAISNGYALAETLEQAGDVESALSAWQKNYRTITEQIQSWSKNWDYFVHRWPGRLEFLRSKVILGLATVPVTRRHWGRLYRGIDDRGTSIAA